MKERYYEYKYWYECIKLSFKNDQINMCSFRMIKERGNNFCFNIIIFILKIYYTEIC